MITLGVCLDDALAGGGVRLDIDGQHWTGHVLYGAALRGAHLNAK